MWNPRFTPYRYMYNSTSSKSRVRMRDAGQVENGGFISITIVKQVKSFFLGAGLAPPFSFPRTPISAVNGG